MAEAIGTESLEEILRQQREAEERARAEAERAQAEAKKAQEQAEASAAEGQKAAQEAEANAKAQTEQATANAAPSVAPEQTIQDSVVPLRNDVEDASANPAAPELVDAGVRSRGLPRVTEQDKTDARYMRAVRDAVLDTSFKVQRYDTEDGYDPGLTKKQMASKLVGHAADLPSESESGNVVSIRFGSVRNKEQAFGLLMTVSDDAEKVKVGKKLASQLGMPVESFLAQAENFMYDNYGRQVFSSPYSDAAKIRTGNNAIKNIGLTDVSGALLDVNTATVPDYLRAARMDPNGETADSIYKYAKALSKVPGSIWYGYDVQPDMFKFMDSADLTKKQYDDEMDKIHQKFTYSEGFNEENLTAYLESYNELKTVYGGNERVLGYMLRDLDKSWSDHTGLKPMTSEQADNALSEMQAEFEQAALNAKDDEETKKGIWSAIKGWVAGAADWAKNTFTPEEKPEEKPEITPVEDIIKEIESGNKASSGGSLIASGGMASVGGQNAAVSRPLASTGSMPSKDELFPNGGTQAGMALDNPLGLSEEALAKAEPAEQTGPVYQPNAHVESLPYDPNMSDEQAWSAYRNGYHLSPENYNQISRFAGNPDISGIVMGELNPDTAIDSVMKHGWYIGDAANTIRSSNADANTKAAAEIALMDFAASIYQEATLPNASNERPPNRNMYDYAIEMNKDHMDRLAEITGLVNTMDSGYSEAAVDAVDERESRMAGYTQQMINGNGNQEIADALASYHEYDWVDLNMDDMCNKVRREASVSGKLFGENGLYWQGNSPAATEYNAVLSTMGKREAMDFRRDLSLRTIDIAEGYARAAQNIGMTTEDFLASAGITSTEQLANIAFSCMEAEGNALANNPDTPAIADAVSAQDTSVHGYFISGKDAVSVAANRALNDWQEGYASAAYNMVTLADYQTTVFNNRRNYVDKYGPIMAPYMYRRDINMDIASGALSKEQGELLRQDMARTYDIFDLGYEVNPDGLKGILQEGMTDLQNRVDKLDAIIGTLNPEQQRDIMNASSLMSNGLSMATGIATMGIASGAGASASVAKFLSAAAGHAPGIWDDSFDQNRKAGMRRGHAALSAAVDTVGQSYIESLNVGSFAEMFFGDVDLTSAIRMFKNKPTAVIGALGGLLVGNPISEGIEESAQGGLQTIMDAFDPLIVAYEKGEKVTWSMAYENLRSCFEGMTGEEFAEEMAAQFKGGAAMGAFFSVLGTAVTGLRSVGDIKAFNKYDSVKMSTQIAEGIIPATKENLGKLYDSLDKDMTDPKFRKYMNKGSAQAQKDRQVVTAMLEGTAIETLDSSVDHAQKAKEYGDKKAAAKSAMDNAQGRWIDLSKRVANGDLEAVPSLTTAQQQLAKAKTAYSEAETAEKMHADAAKIGTDKWLAACKERASVLTAEGMADRMNRIKLARFDAAVRLYDEQVKAYEERAEREKNADIEVMGMTEADIDADIDSMIEADNRVAEAEAGREEMGYDEETVQALREQSASNADRRAAIVRNQRNSYASFSARMQQAQELEDADAYNALKEQRDVVEGRLTKLGEATSDPDAEKKAQDEAKFERTADIATGMTKEQRDAAKLEQQEQNNIDTMDVETFIEERYPNANEEQREHIREMFASSPAAEEAVISEPATVAKNETVAAQQIDPERKKALQNTIKFAGQVKRRFGVNVAVVPTTHEKLKLKSGRSAAASYDRDTDTIYVGENATQGDIVRAKVMHELTHRTEGTEAYKEFSSAVRNAYFKGSAENENAERNRIKSLYERNGVKLTEEGLESELVAYATEKLIGGNQEMVDRLVADSPSVARRIMDAIKGVLDKLRGVKGAEVDQLRAVEKMFQKALDESAKKRTASYQQAMEQSNHPASVQFSVEQLAEATGFDVRRNDDGVPYTLIDKNGNEVTDVTPEMIKKTPIGNLIDTAVQVGTINQGTADSQLRMFADLTTLAAQYKDQAMVWEIAGSQLFSAIKNNSDKQYGTTVDFGTICAKTQAIVDVMSETMLKLGRGLSRDEVIKAYRETANVGYNVPCPVCYVFSRWMGVPSLLNNISEYQDRFTAMSEQDVKDYVSSVEERYAKGSEKPGKEINKAKEDLEKKLDAVTREMQKRLDMGLDMGELSEKAKALEDEYKDVEAYNWVTQALCKRNVRDKNGQVVLDPEFEPTPKEILFDLRRTSEFSLYKKNWTYRSTRGAGMGKAILPHSGARIGDSVKGNKDRWSTAKNPFLSGDMKAAARAVANGRRRMKAQNLIGGQRFQSTSDYRPEWGIDYMMTFLEMQAIGAKVQLYTKVIEAVDMFATAGIETNLSIMGKGNGYHLDENGNPVLGDDDFSSVTGIDFRKAREKTRMYDNVQMILVGLNDDHIRLALANDDISFVIPWHSSGNSEKILSDLMGAVGEKLETGTDYTDTQSDKPVAKPNAQQKAAANLRARILTGKLGKSGLTDADQVVLDTNPYLADLYRRFYVDSSETETYGVKLSPKQASQVFPYEYWDTSLTIDEADENGRRFREYCESIGLEPRFPQFANDPGYWKLLIDRRMYNRDGTYHHPKAIDVTGVSIDSVAQSVGEVKYGDNARTNQAAQATIDEIRAAIPSETYTGDMQYAIDDEDLDSSRYNDDEISFDKPSALPGDDFLRAEIDAWRSSPNYSVDDNTGKRQFANQTIQNNQYIPDYIKQEFLNDPAKSDYSRESNMSMLNTAWNSVQAVGYEAARDRLVNQETKFDTYDNAVALLLMRQALHDGDLDTLMAVATKYNSEGTDQAKALQIRSMMRKMTPTGFAQTVIQDISRKIEERDTKRPGEKRKRERESRKTKEDLNLGNLNDTSAIDTLNRGGSIVIDNKFGVPLNDAKRALIKEFGLEKTARPGDFYNWATTKQRMLEDILTTDDIWAKDSNGMDLVDRLVRMKHGDIVLTKADLQYITDQMAIFDRLADKNSREADLALARAHEAQGNVNGATGRTKRRTWRYVSMLLSVPSAIRNMIGNTAQAIPNAVSDGIAVTLDQIISKFAHTDRTRAHLTAKERIEGWEGFRDEVFNTFRDYFVDKAITQHGEGRYNQSQMGRVYQTQSLETLRHLEGLLMSVGDRNFWKKKFLNSMAEQQRLAEINGTAFDVEAAMETAEAEANYATFNEDSTVRELMSALTEHIPFLDYLMPFVGVPTNIIKRQIEFSPIGIASTAIRHGWAAVRGESFDQRAFVDGMARGLTGSAMMGIGALLLKSGFLKLGTKEEDDDKSYGVRTAQGDQYGVYFTIGDKNYSISTFSPAASALVAGAFFADARGDNERWTQALINATLKNINEIFDASYMSSLADALNTSNGKTFTENLIPAIGSAMISQNIPAPLTHLATSLDPYVRDTKDKDAMMEILNTTLNKIPGARQLLPKKVDVAGRTVENTKQGIAAFVDPFTTSKAVGDPALDEMIRLRDVLTEKDASEPRAHMASDALSGRRNTLTQNKVTYTVSPEEKEEYRKLYGDLWRNGGITYDKKGKRVHITQGVEDLIRSRAYQLMTPEEQAKAIKEILQKAKEGATYQIMNHK